MDIQTTKTLGGIGALLMLISPLSGFAAGGFGSLLGLVGIILVLIAMKGLADNYNESGIFNNTLYGVILTIVGAVVFVATIVVGAVGFLSELNLDLDTLSTDPTALSNMDWEAAIDFSTLGEYIAIILAGLVVLFVFVVIAAIFYRKSLSSLSEKTGVGLFGTTGLIILIGAVLTIILVGFLLLWVALLLLTIAFFSIKTDAVPPPPPPPEPPT
ncbi:MAG: DUF996 domain-containing protein [Candidatus Bathyarchaeota archaeon]|nr:DUF996 domain-containing protein [Candidatus Bathyarchaeum sp.]